MEVYASTLFNCTVYQGYGSIIAKKMFEPAGFQLALGLKDCTLVLEEDNATKTPMPLASLLHGRLLSSVARSRKVGLVCSNKDCLEEAGQVLKPFKKNYIFITCIT